MKRPDRLGLDYGSLLWIGAHVLILFMICIPAIFVAYAGWGGGIFGAIVVLGILIWGFIDAFKDDEEEEEDDEDTDSPPQQVAFGEDFHAGGAVIGDESPARAVLDGDEGAPLEDVVHEAGAIAEGGDCSYRFAFCRH